MKCTSPIFIRDKKSPYFTTFSRQDGSKFCLDGHYVPCGQCIACRLNYGKFWSIRLMDELKYHDKACFATFTYDNEHVPDSLLKRDIQLFWKRLRKERKVRYFCCGEYGDSFGRPHFHAIIFGIAPNEQDVLLKYWDKGFIKLGTVTEDSCAYVCKYMTKKIKGSEAVEKWKQENPGKEQEFVLMSRRPGIGGEPSPELIRFMEENGFVWRKTQKSSIPRYWKDKFDLDFTGVSVLEPDYQEKLLQQNKFNDNIMTSIRRLFNK